MPHIIVTGAAGFIGSHLTDALLFDGHTVFGIDNLSTGSRDNMKRFIDHQNFHFFQTDISNKDDLENTMNAIDGASMIYHLAAMGSVPKSLQDPQASFRNNVVTTQNMLEAARKNKIDDFIFTSSSSVYGDQEGHFHLKSEYMIPHPQSPYAFYKLMCEHFMEMYSINYGMNTTSFRLFNVFGPRQAVSSPYSAVIPNLCEALIKKQPFNLFGGEQSRDFTFVGNVVEIFLQCLDHVPQEHVYNIGHGNSVSIKQLINDFEHVSGEQLNIQMQQYRKGDVLNSKASILKLQCEFDFSPESASLYFKETYDYYKGLFDAT